MDFLNKIRNLIKASVKTKTIDTKLIEVDCLGKEQPVFLINPYGTHLNLPDEGIITILLQQEGYEDSLLGIPTDTENRDSYEKKEVGYGIPTLKARIIYRKDDKIYFKIGEVEGGDFMVRFNQLKLGYDQLKADHNTLLQKVLHDKNKK